jgi:hypothetical protein
MCDPDDQPDDRLAQEPAYAPTADEESTKNMTHSQKRASRRKSSRKGGLWIAKYNPIDHFQDFCEDRLESVWFWGLIFVTTIVEPYLCSYRPEGKYLRMQLLLMAVASVLFVIQLIGSASKEWDQIMLEEFAADKAPDILPSQLKQLSVTKIMLFFTSEGEFMMEFFCLALGWILIFRYPGIAVLRCFRVFRLLW